MKEFNGLRGWDREERYVLKEASCREEEQGRKETVMCLGNGYMGIRSAFCESVDGQSPLTLIAGLYDRQPLESEELAPLPDICALPIKVNGVNISPIGNQSADYERYLDLSCGLMSYSYRPQNENGDSYMNVSHRRFVSMQNKHFVAMETVIRTDGDVKLSATAAINGRGTVDGSQHSFVEELTVLDTHILWYGGRTAMSSVSYRVGMGVRVFLNGEDISHRQRYSSERRLIATKVNEQLGEGDELRILRYALFYTENDMEWSDREQIKELIAIEISSLLTEKFDFLLTQSKKQWAKRWRTCDVFIDSEDSTETIKMRLAIYHSLIMCPADDDRISIAAKGLTGMGYAGHVFWDCEIFNLPFFIYTNPQAARRLCTYRFHTLNGAREKAKEFGYEGAMYPWESAGCNGDEQSPRFKNYSPDNTPRHVTCGEIEHHVTCDVAYGICSYADITDDKDFMEKYGYEILFETARFWLSRLEYVPHNDRYEIRQVTGPDEYQEYVDNDTFTNYMVHKNLSIAVEKAKLIESESPELYFELDARLSINLLVADIKAKLPKLYLPVEREDGLIPQNDTYLDQDRIDLREYKESGINRLIYRDYSLKQLRQFMVSKQADVVQLIALMPELFPKETVIKNLNFYEERCLHDSSLSLTAFAKVAVDCGFTEQGYQLFLRALDTDFGERSTLCFSGIHAANCGGLWQTAVLGFIGLCTEGDRLSISPALPKEWKEVSVCICFRGSKLRLTVFPDSVLLHNLDDKEISIEVFGNSIVLEGICTKIISFAGASF